MPDVVDRDQGFKRAIDAFYGADGVVGRVGILTSGPKYPARGSQKTGTSVAMVAAILQAKDAWLSETIDGRDMVTKQEFEWARDRIIRGEDPVKLMAEVCENIRHDIRAKLTEKGHVKTGRLRDTISWRVTAPKGSGLSSERSGRGT